jgi:hypothetical protein
MVIDHIITNIPAECFYTEVINRLLSDHFAVYEYKFDCTTINEML